MNRIVDTLLSHENRVRFLLWNPDGTQLGKEKFINLFVKVMNLLELKYFYIASAGDDETLHIWNFLQRPKSLKNIDEKPVQDKSKRSHKFSLTNSFLDSR